jgi:outer membrane receptor for ferrienterochelin and colicin
LFNATQSVPYFVDDACRDIRVCAVAFSDDDIGDTARDKWWWGLSWQWRAQSALTVRARRIAARETVSSNPIRRVDAYTTWDLNYRWRDAGVNGLDVGVSIHNLFDTTYFHPGLREANAGITPGQFDSNGIWHGSAGWYSSLLPQPGRQFFLYFNFHY